MRLGAGTPAVRGADVPVRSGQGWAAASASSGTPPPLSLLRLVLRTQPRSGRKSDGASAGSTAGELLCGTRSSANGTVALPILKSKASSTAGFHTLADQLRALTLAGIDTHGARGQVTD